MGASPDPGVRRRYVPLLQRDTPQSMVTEWAPVVCAGSGSQERISPSKPYFRGSRAWLYQEQACGLGDMSGWVPGMQTALPGVVGHMPGRLNVVFGNLGMPLGRVGSRPGGHGQPAPCPAGGFPRWPGAVLSTQPRSGGQSRAREPWRRAVRSGRPCPPDQSRPQHQEPRGSSGGSAAPPPCWRPAGSWPPRTSGSFSPLTLRLATRGSGWQGLLGRAGTDFQSSCPASRNLQPRRVCKARLQGT